MSLQPETIPAIPVLSMLLESPLTAATKAIVTSTPKRLHTLFRALARMASPFPTRKQHDRPTGFSGPIVGHTKALAGMIQPERNVLHAQHGGRDTLSLPSLRFVES